ncbi:hypothetical protein [Actinoplanes sp. URMC 104]|uniref:hypothetical protein n=1 Tax=Actinoplanes sp. URMC 104 TaxID=3423409 RepID=UPI003F1BF3C7
MFPYNDPQTVLELHRQHVAELTAHAAARRLAREARETGPARARRFGRWPRRARAEQPAPAAAVA